MTSDVAAARALMERAFDCLSGNDDFSLHARDAVSLLIDAMAAIEHRRPTAEIIRFPPPVGKVAGRRG